MPDARSDGAGDGQFEENGELTPDAQKLWRTFLQGWLGEGEGAACCLFFVPIGVYTVIMAMLSLLYGPLRNLERYIPDADELPEPAELGRASSQETDVAQNPVSG